MQKKHVPIVILTLILGIAVFNGFALYYFLYWRILWLDIPMHFLGGFWLGISGLWFYYLSGYFEKTITARRRTRWYVALVAVTSAVVFGLLWEVYELGIDTFIRITTQYDIQDTSADLFFDVLGALTASWLFIRGKNYEKELI